MLWKGQLIFRLNSSRLYRIQRWAQRRNSVCFTQNSPCMVISSVCLTVMQRLLKRLQSQYSIIHPIVFFISHSMDGWAAGERSCFCGRDRAKSIAFIWRNCREIVKMTSPVMRLCWVMMKQYPCRIEMEERKAKKETPLAVLHYCWPWPED